MLRPLGGRVLVRPDSVEDSDPIYKSAKQAGLSIWTNENDKKREEQAVVKGTVVAIGDLAFQAPVGNGTPWVVVGSRVYYAKYAGKDVEDPETKERLLLLNDEDLCVELKGE